MLASMIRSVMGVPFGIPKRSSALCMCIALRIAAISPITRLRPSSTTKILRLRLLFVYTVVILRDTADMLTFQPMPLSRRPRPFNHPEWLFELKYDGFRALARIKRGQCELISRNGHPFSSFAELGKSIALALPHLQDAVLDGEIVCLDRRGRPQFNDLLFKRGQPCFFAFDLLYADGKDCRRDSLVERKAALRHMIHRLPADSPVRFADHI